MKMVLIVALLLVSQWLGRAQGTLLFEVRLNGAGALPPNSSPYEAQGEFSLDSANHFNGFVFTKNLFAFSDRITLVQIFESSSPAILGTPLFAFTPGEEEIPNIGISVGGRRYDLSTDISAANRASLLAGNWYVNITTPEFPSGEIRGQITIVPEPTITALLVLGCATVILFRRKIVGNMS